MDIDGLLDTEGVSDGALEIEGRGDLVGVPEGATEGIWEGTLDSVT